MPGSPPDDLIHTPKQSCKVIIVVSETQKAQELTQAQTALSGRADVGIQALLTRESMLFTCSPSGMNLE